MSRSDTTPVTSLAAEMGVVAVLWWLTFRLNDWLFSSLEFNSQVNWIFLPAALRVLAVLLFSWRGSVGLFVGALLTSTHDEKSNWVNDVGMAVVSALAPLVAIWFTSLWLKIATDLKGLNFGQLALLCLAGAATSAMAHTVLFSYQAGDHQLLWGFFPMFAGDLLGTLMVVYAAHFALRVWLPAQQNERR